MHHPRPTPSHMSSWTPWAAVEIGFPLRVGAHLALWAGGGGLFTSAPCPGATPLEDRGLAGGLNLTYLWSADGRWEAGECPCA